jgi:hypothetical protein
MRVCAGVVLCDAVGFPGLLIAAVAERERVTLVQYDSDYDLIAAVTGQPVQWVVHLAPCHNVCRCQEARQARQKRAPHAAPG